MSTNDYYDVLRISDEKGIADIIQSYSGNECLGAYFNNGTARLYFQAGIKNHIEPLIFGINTDLHFNW